MFGCKRATSEGCCGASKLRRRSSPTLGTGVGLRWRVSNACGRAINWETSRSDPRYDEPLSEPAEFWGRLQNLRGGQQRYNVIVYYVDTLRQDVTEDSATMPSVVQFGREGLSFAHAYAAGSDTLRSLPVLTGGNYDSSITPTNDVLRVAKRSGYESVLVIAKSAEEFLGKLRPQFHFDRNESIADHPLEQQVWGYGAQQPTAKETSSTVALRCCTKKEKNRCSFGFSTSISTTGVSSTRSTSTTRSRNFISKTTRRNRHFVTERWPRPSTNNSDV